MQYHKSTTIYSCFLFVELTTLSKWVSWSVPEDYNCQWTKAAVAQRNWNLALRCPSSIKVFTFSKNKSKKRKKKRNKKKTISLKLWLTKNLSKFLGNSSHLSILSIFPSHLLIHQHRPGTVPFRKSLNQKNTRFSWQIAIEYLLLNGKYIHKRSIFPCYVCLRGSVPFCFSFKKGNRQPFDVKSMISKKNFRNIYGQNSWYIGSGNMVRVTVTVYFFKGYFKASLHLKKTIPTWSLT